MCVHHFLAILSPHLGVVFFFFLLTKGEPSSLVLSCSYNYSWQSINLPKKKFGNFISALWKSQEKHWREARDRPLLSFKRCLTPSFRDLFSSNDTSARPGNDPCSPPPKDKPEDHNVSSLMMF